MSMARSRPFTLLLLIATGWLTLRLMVPGLAPLPPVNSGAVVAAAAQIAPAMEVTRREHSNAGIFPGPRPSSRPATGEGMPRQSEQTLAAGISRWAQAPLPPRVIRPAPSAPFLAGPTPIPMPPGPPPAAFPPSPPPRTDSRHARPHAFRSDRFALSAWLLARGGDGAPALTGASALGSSQAGLRAAWRLDRADRVEAFGRLSTTGRPGDGAEAAVGVALRPHLRLPVQLVAERRQALAGEGGRSAFAAYAVGGIDSVRAGPLLVDAYGAAGVVGSRSRDLFAEGSAVARLPVARLGPVDLSAGGGVWAAAQPGTSRIDGGPRAQLRWRDGPIRPVISLDWRQRIAGDARPQSGPALTVGVDF